jgi:hypothetical protein
MRAQGTIVGFDPCSEWSDRVKSYRLIIYWWSGPSDEHRTFGGEYGFEANDDDAAIQHAHAQFMEQIDLADQTVLIDDSGRIVWQNQPPESGR